MAPLLDRCCMECGFSQEYLLSSLTLTPQVDICPTCGADSFVPLLAAPAAPRKSDFQDIHS